VQQKEQFYLRTAATAAEQAGARAGSERTVLFTLVTTVE
jgi:hypothetical protein